MTDSPRQVAQRPGGRTARVRAQILDATVRLVARHGIAGFRYEEVAELAGVHKMSVYRNWPDRDLLVGEALLVLAEEMAPLADTGDLRRDLVDFLVAMATSLADPRGRALVHALQSTPDSPEVRRTVDVVIARRVSLVRRRVDSAVGHGELPPVDAHFLADLLSGPVHLKVGRDQRPFDRADAERITDVVLAGVRATASA
ncbi:TetR/AcrR family transcriptional regulator [Umezawaea sp. Da 62-37]|uniref:TetR/AcrR family transcriptional regulator n=1 Tax=Umezawaea sp. Da 62-37 TaxID=3075927 RepID=UPI0028F74205|nr:TetR/AcrR family transcriptional regulator [Umezawaea sp. Da 62-37]WNV85919.1 TetR/AcrR family transcriptional regulator [Umezawaea sp. Da 62-37]